MQDVQPQSRRRLVEVVLTEEQAGLLAAAADITLRSHEAEDGLVTLNEQEELGMKQLAVFFVTVASSPQHFPVTGRMAKTVKSRTRAAKGEAKQTSRKNKRKARQERRMSFSKRRRKERREMAENFNKAREVYEAELAEIQAIQEQRQREIENEPKFDVQDIMGNVVIAGVPQSMIRAADTNEPVDITTGPLPSKVILPGSAEHLGVELDEGLIGPDTDRTI